MNLENTFYALGIVFMVINISLLIMIVAAIFYIKKKIEEIQNRVEEKLNIVKDVAGNPDVLAEGAGALAVSLLTFGMKKIFGRKK